MAIQKAARKTVTKKKEVQNKKFSSKLQKALEVAADNEAEELAAKQAEAQSKLAEEQAAQNAECVKTFLEGVHATISSIPYHAAPAVGVTLHPAALTSTDAQGYPSTRTVVPSGLATDLSEVKMTTQKGTRKEAEIKANSKVAVHFQDQRGRGGWVTLKGKASMQPGAQDGTLEIVMKPTRCEAMSYIETSLLTDTEGWKPVLLTRDDSEWKLVEA